MTSSGRTLALVQTCVRHFRQSATRRAGIQTEVPSPKLAKLKESQKFFGVEDSTPVHLKGGLGDRIWLGATLIMTTIGLGMSAEVLYKLAYK